MENLLEKVKLNLILQHDEDDELLFSIGKILRVDKDVVHFNYFDTMGAWKDEKRRIPLDKITSVSIEDHYSNVFHKYIKPPIEN